MEQLQAVPLERRVSKQNYVLAFAKKYVFPVIVMLIALPSVYGQSSASLSICNPKNPLIFAFFNGVLTTEVDALATRETLRSRYGTSSPAGQPIQYELMYNHSNGFEDFVQTFEQRMKEHDGILAGRFELFFSVIKGGGAWWSSITGSVLSVKLLLGALSDAALATSIRTMSVLFANPPDYQNYAEHRTKIDGFVAENKRLLFFAHSQGNLFANQAFDYAKPKLSTGAIKLIHVAPASPTLRGDWTLADLDLVINGLRLTGTVPANTDAIPNYFSRTAGLNGEKDFMGHGLLEIYLSKDLATATRINNQVASALTDLSNATCGTYKLVMSIEAMNNPASQCKIHTTINAFNRPADPSSWSPMSCYSKLRIRPQNRATGADGFSYSNQPIIDSASCTFTNANMRYLSSTSVGERLRFGSTATEGYTEMYRPYAGSVDPSEWDLQFESYISGDLPYGRTPAPLTADCQITYRETVQMPSQTISASMVVPNVISTFEFNRRYYAAGNVFGGFPKVTAPNCGAQDCAGMMP
jgi:hypothetical protein